MFVARNSISSPWSIVGTSCCLFMESTRMLWPWRSPSRISRYPEISQISVFSPNVMIIPPFVRTWCASTTSRRWYVYFLFVLPWKIDALISSLDFLSQVTLSNDPRCQVAGPKWMRAKSGDLVLAVESTDLLWKCACAALKKQESVPLSVHVSETFDGAEAAAAAAAVSLKLGFWKYLESKLS